MVLGSRTLEVICQERPCWNTFSYGRFYLWLISLLELSEDQHTWSPMPSSSSREIITKTAYHHFLGAVDFEPWKEIWKTWACVFSRQVWLVVFSLVSLPRHTPGPNGMVFTEW